MAQYTAMLSAILHNPVINTCYEKHVTEGKYKKSAVTACKRKMMVRVNTVVRNNQEWQMN